MKIKIKSKELVKILQEQKKVNEDITKIHKKLVEADKEHKKLQFKVQRIKDKGSVVLDKALQAQYDMNELDYSGQMEIVSNEDVEVSIHNLFNDYFDNKEEAHKRLLEERKNKTGNWADPMMLIGHKIK